MMWPGESSGHLGSPETSCSQYRDGAGLCWLGHKWVSNYRIWSCSCERGHPRARAGKAGNVMHYVWCSCHENFRCCCQAGILPTSHPGWWGMPWTYNSRGLHWCQWFLWASWILDYVVTDVVQVDLPDLTTLSVMHVSTGWLVWEIAHLHESQYVSYWTYDCERGNPTNS